MRSQFPHATAWTITAALFGVLVAAQIWQSCHAAVRPSPQANLPVVEIVPQDRPDLHGFDEQAFADEFTRPSDMPR